MFNHDLLALRDMTRKRGWNLAVVVPEADLPAALDTHAALADETDCYCGRTVVFPQGGTMTLYADLDVPPTTEFVVIFLNTDHAMGSARISAWRQASRDVVGLHLT